MIHLSSFCLPFLRQKARTVLLTLVFVNATAQPALQSPSAKLSSPESIILVRDVSGLSVSSSDLASEVRRAPVAQRKKMLSSPDGVLQLASDLLSRRVMAADAEREGLTQDPLIAAALRVARDRVLSDARLVRLDAENAPTEAALDAYARNIYQTSAARFELPGQTRARQILLANCGTKSLKKARDLVVQLRAGASFEELARANSIDSRSAARGGDLGVVGAGQMLKPFEDALNELGKPGDLSDPVETQLGYHIIRLEERRVKRVPAYEEVRTQLIDEARKAILSQFRNQKVQSLQKDFVVDREAIEAMIKLEATR